MGKGSAYFVLFLLERTGTLTPNFSIEKSTPLYTKDGKRQRISCSFSA